MTTMESVLQRSTRTHPQRDAARLATATCRCGQALDLCMRSHCPRCGTNLIPH